jgi:hypothetical protein
LQKVTNRSGTFNENEVFNTEIITKLNLKKNGVLFQKREEKDGGSLSYFISPIPKALFF